MAIEQFLRHLHDDLDIKLVVQGEKLRLNAPDGVMTDALREKIRQRKDDILQFLQTHPSWFEDHLNVRPDIVPANHAIDGKNAYLLSFAQLRLWFLFQLEGKSPAYNMTLGLRLRGHLDKAALAQTISSIIQRHDSLRTCFRLLDDQPVQLVMPPTDFHLLEQDLSKLPEVEQKACLLEWLDAEKQWLFDLSQGGLFRTSLIRCSEEQHVLLVNMHHIISDGWSIGVLTHELSQLYTAFVGGKPSPLPALPIQYHDFAYWQRQYLSGDLLKTQLAYWKQQLSNAPPLLELPTDKPRPALKGNAGDSVTFMLPASVLASLKQLGRQTGTTLFMVVLAVFSVLLSRYSRQTDMVIGAPIANRNQSQTEGLIGFFVNTLPIRLNLAHNPSLLELLQQAKTVALQAYAHQDIPFEQLVEELNPLRSMSHTPLFQVTLAVQNTPESRLELPGLSVSQMDGRDVVAKFDLSLYLTETSHGLSGVFEYSTDLFEADTVGRMVGHFQSLLMNLLANPAQPVMHAPLLTLPEQQQLKEWTQTHTDYPRDQSLAALFSARASQMRDKTALVFEGQTLSYAELEQRSNQLAHYLMLEHHVVPGTLVGLSVTRSVEMVVGMLGIIKAGAAYVPLDPDYPAERLAFMLDDCRLTVLLTQQALVGQLTCPQVSLVRLDQDWSSIATHSAEFPSVAVTQAHLAYVIYTSGSTGQPKGVAVPQQGVVRLVCQTDYIRITADDVIAQASNASFDAATFEIWGALLHGACLVGVDKSTLLSPESLENALVTHRVSILFLTTALFNQVAQTKPTAFGQLRYLLFGGEAVDPLWVRQIRETAPPQHLLHVYGPTENTTFSTWFEVTELESNARTVPIGRAVANTRLYVLDEHQQPVPVQMPGELYLAGEGLAQGYWQRPDANVEKFVNLTVLGKAERLYRTGDVVRWLPDGVLEYVGRTDHQVKLRGFRIELGEIDAALERHPAVHEAVVILHGVGVQRRLVAFVSLSEPLDDANSLLRAWLQPLLPEYMQPTVITVLPQFPLTPNGKIDRKVLAELADGLAPETTEALVALQTPMEQQLAAIWSELLRVDSLGANSHFFRLGGHSLLATQLVSRIQTACGVNFPLRRVFETPLLAAQAAWLDGQQQQVAATQIPPRPLAAPLALTHAQQRLWFLNRLEAGSATYNMPLALRLQGELAIPWLRESLRELTKRHEALRMCFPEQNGEASVSLLQPYDPLQVIDLRDLKAAEQAMWVQQYAQQHAQHVFDLATGPLFSLQVLVLAQQQQVLLFNMHHIISDGWSMGVLVRDWGELYAACLEQRPAKLPALDIQYSDYAHWQHTWLQGEVLEQQLHYWKGQLSDAPALLELPTDFPRPPVQTYRGAHLHTHLEAGLAGQLEQLAQQQGVTLYMLLLAAFQLLLGRISGQDDILIGTPIANRTQQQTENLVGFFVNTLVMRTRLVWDEPFAHLLQQVKQTALDAYAHQDVPFEQLVEQLNPERSLSYSPLFQVMFSLQNAAPQGVALPNLRVDALDEDTPIAQFDLSLNVEQTANGMVFGWEYATDLFTVSSVTRLADALVVLLHAVVETPFQALTTLPLLTAAQITQLTGWNATAASYDVSATVVSLFEQQAEQYPERIAVEWAGQLLSYADLNRRANYLAHALRSHSAQPGQMIGLCLQRSPDLIVGMLGILKAGCAYLPIDPAYPVERIQHILDDSQVDILLTTRSNYLMGITTQARILRLDNWTLFAHQSAGNPVNPITPEGLAYVIYTSGSTGKPKGVLIGHAALHNFVHAACERYQISPTDRMLQFASFSFDAAVEEIFPTLLQGATLVLRTDNMMGSAQAFMAFCQQERITVLDLPTAYWQSLLSDTDILRQYWPDTVRLVIIGGEAVSADSARHWLAQMGDYPILHNTYGPTEATVVATASHVTRENVADVPIGSPLANTRLYVLDARLQPVPLGVPGELCIAGMGLAQGYLNQPVLTAEKFVTVELFGKRERVYRSGDLVRWLPQGELHYLGRIDQQVKLRGFRIELGEIEAELHHHEAVKQAVVVVYGAGETMSLAAYLSVRQPIGAEQLRDYLKRRLPDYMLPSSFTFMETLPLSQNGKLDRKALPEPELRSANETLALPSDALEQTLLEIWEASLAISPLCIHDNFFQLGGHSLLAVKLMSHIQQRLQVHLPLAALFQAPTVHLLAQQIRQHDQARGWSNLISIQPQGDQVPLYCLPGAGGNVMYLSALSACLGNAQPFYGLQTPGLDGITPIPESVVSLASQHIQALRQHQPHGPYRLAGHSAGGRVAFEMARQLEAQGESIALLAILDTNVPLPSLAALTANWSDAEWLWTTVQGMEGLTGVQLGLTANMLQQQPSFEAMYELILHHLKSQQLLFAPDATVDELKAFAEVFRANLRNHIHYQPHGKLRCPIHLYRATELLPGQEMAEQGEDWGWREFTDAGVNITWVSGTHFTMVYEPHVQVLAEKLAEELH